MTNDQFNELAGRIQGLGDYVLHLTAELEVKQCIDGENLTKVVRKFAENRCFDGDHLEATKRTLIELTEFINQARIRRQENPHHRRSRQYHS
jgi:hypothetical protein